LNIAQELQTKLNSINPETDRASLIWAHGFLTSVVENIAAHIRELEVAKKPTPIETISKLQEEARRLLDDMERRTEKCTCGDQSRRPSVQELLKRFRDELDDTNPTELSGVPAKITPGPKGLSGGVALPLPAYTDYKMQSQPLTQPNTWRLNYRIRPKSVRAESTATSPR
jgi:hypothetical protein